MSSPTGVQAATQLLPAGQRLVLGASGGVTTPGAEQLDAVLHHLVVGLAEVQRPAVDYLGVAAAPSTAWAYLGAFLCHDPSPVQAILVW